MDELCLDKKDIDLIHQWYWVVMLSDGTKVYQDDGRPGTEPSAWIRLGRFLEKNRNVGIQRFGVYFRDNVVFLPDEQSGYYFAKGILRGVGSDLSMDYYVMGYQQTPESNVQFLWIKTPELLTINSYTKPIVECPSPMMISNPPGLTWFVPKL